MTGKERKHFITSISRVHAEEMDMYIKSVGSESKYLHFGYMLGLEMSAYFAGMITLSKDLEGLRKKECSR